MEAPLSSQPAYLLAPVTAIHPSDLETDDSSLATEVLPAPPPLTSITAQRRDSHLKRPANIFSYLPASDPGSTYSGLMGGLGLSLVPEDEGRLRKRARIDKTAINNRAQRASARNLTPNVPPALLFPPETHPASDSVIELPGPPPRAKSFTTPDDLTTGGTSSTSNGATKPKTRDKGKAKEKFPPMRVKEEPQAISLDTIEPVHVHQPNDDHCSSCRSNGALVYCDGCPRSFHLWCLDPPLDAQDVPEGENRWFCPACVIRQNPPPKPRRSLFAPLFQQLQTTIPTEFELPDEIRAFFKDVITGPRGTYQDSSETRLARSSRFGIQEERDPFRLKDKNGAPVLCFRCGKSALPENETSSGPSTSHKRETRGRRPSVRAPPGEVLWKSIVSCDHCTLHWHLDCLDPPLSSMPPAHKKWMCPTHVEHIAPKRRVPRQLPPVTDVMERNRPNNGNIEIIPADHGADKARRMNVDEVHINGRRYRVPERVIVLDFWDKLGGRARQPIIPSGLLSGTSSPLTSLSSLDGIGPSTLPAKVQSPAQEQPEPKPDSETMRAVELLFGCRTAVVRNRVDRMEVDLVPRSKTEIAVQTDPEGCVKLDVKEAEQLSGIISATLQDLNGPGSPQTSAPQPKLTPKPKTNPPRVARSTTASGSTLRKSARLPSDTGSARVTRSKAAPSAVSAASSPLQRSKTETLISSHPPRKTAARISLSAWDIARMNERRAAASSASSASSVEPPKSTQSAVSSPTRASRLEQLKSLKRSASDDTPTQVEHSGSVTLPPPASTPTKSPFKIRIPREINTAVAAATAAAAASASSAASQASDAPRSLRRQTSSMSELSSVSTVGKSVLKPNGARIELSPESESSSAPDL